MGDFALKLQQKSGTKKIVAAVAQGVFKGNHCKLIPLFYQPDSGIEKPEKNEFDADGEFLCIFQNSVKGAMPGMLTEVVLQQNDRSVDSKGKKLSKYVALPGKPHCLSSESGAEVFILNKYNENELESVLKKGDNVTFPHCPSEHFFVIMNGKVCGPFKAVNVVRDEGTTEISAKVSPARRDAYEIDKETFYKKYAILTMEEKVSCSNRSRLYTNAEDVTWHILPHKEYQKIVQDIKDGKWSAVNLISFEDQLRLVVSAAKSLNPNERKLLIELQNKLHDEYEKLGDVKRLQEVKLESPDEFDDMVHDAIATLVETGYLDTALKDAEDKWVKNRKEDLAAQIASVQKDLQDLQGGFAAEQKRQKEQLAEEKAEELAEIAAAQGKIEADREQIKADCEALEETKKQIETMLQSIQNETTEQAKSIIQVYPFLSAKQASPAAETTAESESAPREAPQAEQESEFQKHLKVLESPFKDTEKIEQVDFLKTFFEYVEGKSHFPYDRDDLRRFHTSVLCEGLTILAGASGIGKSSLAHLYGDVLSGVDDKSRQAAAPRDGTHVIHVSSTWMERADILGFVNTVTGEFSPSDTGLFQRLIYAQEDYDHHMDNGGYAVYPICLDEMNLSQIEHYFNDFMQLLEKETQDERSLRCFSEFAVKKGSVFHEYHTIKLAPSLRFIGTVNEDETTKRMSARLLDRTNVIRLSDKSLNDSSSSDGQGVSAGKGVSYGKYSSWAVTDKDSLGKAREFLEKFLPKIKSPLQDLGTTIGPRVEKGMIKYIASSVPLIKALNNGMADGAEQIALDEQIAQRVLSKVRMLTDNKQRKALEDIKKILPKSQWKQSGRLIEELLRQDDLLLNYNE